MSNKIFIANLKGLILLRTDVSLCSMIFSHHMNLMKFLREFRFDCFKLILQLTNIFFFSQVIISRLFIFGFMKLLILIRKCFDLSLAGLDRCFGVLYFQYLIGMVVFNLRELSAFWFQLFLSFFKLIGPFCGLLFFIFYNFIQFCYLIAELLFDCFKVSSIILTFRIAFHIHLNLFHQPLFVMLTFITFSFDNIIL